MRYLNIRQVRPFGPFVGSGIDFNDPRWGQFWFYFNELLIGLAEGAD